MSNEYVMTALKELLQPVNRPETVDAYKIYHILGAHWYAEGLYIKDTKPGSGIHADKVYRVEEGDFVYNRLFAWKGSFAVATYDNHNCYVSNEFPVFKIDQTKIDAKYLWKYFSREPAWNEALGLSSGGTPTSRNRLKEEKLLAMEIPLPPLEEQRRIVTRIEELAAKIEEARGLRREAVEETELFLASYRNSLFTPKDEWVEARISDVCYAPQYGYTDSATNIPVGPHFLRITDIQDGHINWKQVPYCQCPNKDHYLLKKDDIVFARTGATTGKSILIKDCPEAIFASYLIRLRVKQTVSAEYLYHYFQTPSYWAQITDEKKGTGQPNVNGTKLSAIKVPIAPVEEQSEIIEALNQLNITIKVLKQRQTEIVTELDALLPSILDKAFKGEL